MTTASALNLNLTLLCLITQVVLLFCINLTHGQDLDRFSEFDWSLTKAVGERINDNVVISPISVKLVLAMLYEGAGGDTYKQLEEVLGLKRYDRTMATLEFSNINRLLQEETPDYDLDIGTKLFLDKSTQLNEFYNKTLTRKFNASLEQVDFSKPDLAVKAINKWAAVVTKGHIKELISEADAKDSVVLLLLNAIYFKGKWFQPFPTNQTTQDVFYLSPSETVQTEFMNSVQTQKYADSYDLEASIIRLPYMGYKFSMYIIVPNDVDGLNKLMKKITPTILRELLWKTMEEVEVHISLPKFHFDFATSLRPILEKLGLRDMFSEKANLNGITKDKTDNLMVSDVIQKAGILVNEQGSTAYVATQVDLVSKFGEHVTNLVVDRPFLFFIHDESTNTVVFVGKVINPNPSGQVSEVQLDSMPNVKPILIQPFPYNNFHPNNTQQNNANNAHGVHKEGQISGGNLQNKAGESDSWKRPGGIQEHTSNMGNPAEPELNVTNPAYPDIHGSQSESGYVTDDSEILKQNFDQERNAFFDTELLRELCESEKSNLVASPVSVKTVLGMIYEGAAGDTEQEISSELRLPKNKTKALKMLYSLQRELHTPVSSNLKWIMANRLLVSAKLPTLPEYNQNMRSMYHASVDLAKFESPSETAANINRWINTATEGFIPKLLEPDSLAKDTQMVLLNAVYFKGDWLYPFNKRFSQLQCFYPEPKNCKQVNMMTQRFYIKYDYHKQLFAHIFELPYSDSRFSMVLVVPDAEVDLVDVLKNLPFCPILPFLKEITPSEVQLSLPSFTVEYTKDLTSTLTKMGMGSMFSDNADLRSMFGQKRGKISKILHKAKIVVNEKGTEAGAGTAGVIVPLMNSRLEVFTVNKPFLFYIRDKRSGFLFTGRVSDPSI